MVVASLRFYAQNNNNKTNKRTAKSLHYLCTHFDNQEAPGHIACHDNFVSLITEVETSPFDVYRMDIFLGSGRREKIIFSNPEKPISYKIS